MESEKVDPTWSLEKDDELNTAAQIHSEVEVSKKKANFAILPCMKFV